MQQRIVVVGSGFAGLWSALGAKRLLNLHPELEVEVLVIAPESSLVLRPRLYEHNAKGMKVPLDEIFQATGIRFMQGTAEAIDSDKDVVVVLSDGGSRSQVSYDRLILAAGSQLLHPQSVSGLAEHTFDVDTFQGATRLESRLEELPSLPPSPARDTVVVCGAGFTGIELATELPSRLKAIFKSAQAPKVVLVNSADEVGAELGPGPRPTIEKALASLHVEVRSGSAVQAVDSTGVTLASGEHIPSLTAIWTAGMGATPLTAQIDGPRDPMGRLHVDQDLRVPSCKRVFATGDACRALTGDSDGHYTLMSCQHAQILGDSQGTTPRLILLANQQCRTANPAT
uniref:FAD/NAD(P)-binding domain-containing protein n=1 Tax=Bionectria ochroleuca TaxID=29856 RepID=A0A8H7K2E8_BIOOC